MSLMRLLFLFGQQCQGGGGVGCRRDGANSVIAGAFCEGFHVQCMIRVTSCISCIFAVLAGSLGWAHKTGKEGVAEIGIPEARYTPMARVIEQSLPAVASLQVVQAQDAHGGRKRFCDSRGRLPSDQRPCAIPHAPGAGFSFRSSDSALQGHCEDEFGGSGGDQGGGRGGLEVPANRSE